MYSLILGTKTLIVLSSDEAVKELLDRRSGIYSDRQDMYIGQTLCSDGLRMLMMVGQPLRELLSSVQTPSTDTIDRGTDLNGGWSAELHDPRCRVALLTQRADAQDGAQSSQPERGSEYVPYQMLENKQMLNDLLDTPNDFLKHIRRYSNALTTSMVFGWRTPTYENAAIQQLFNGFNEFAEINQTGTAALIDFFPLLRNLPDWVLPTQKKARELHKAERELYLRHWLKAKDEIRKGTISQLFLRWYGTSAREGWLR